MKDEIFKEAGSGKKPFEFNAQVARVFDDMVSRSVPFYSEVLRMSAELAHTSPTPFAATIAELDKDRAALARTMNPPPSA